MTQHNLPSFETITYDDFRKVKICVGTIISAEFNPKAIKPAYILKIDFGDSGIFCSSAQLTRSYQPSDLIGKQIAGVLNFPAKRIAGVKSEVLVLAAVDERHGSVLLSPTLPINNGDPVF
jgi:tRNA-binding protein